MIWMTAVYVYVVNWRIIVKESKICLAWSQKFATLGCEFKGFNKTKQNPSWSSILGKEEVDRKPGRKQKKLTAVDKHTGE